MHYWVLFAIAVPFSLSAQMVPYTSAEPTTIEIPESLTREEVRDLIARMSDDQVRELIINQLDKLAIEHEQATDPAAYVGQLREGMHVAWAALAGTLKLGDKIKSLAVSIWQQMTGNSKISGWYLLFQLIGLLVVGWIAERLARHLLERAASRPVDVLSRGKRFDLACYGMVMGMLELGAFAVGALLFVEIAGQQTLAAQVLWY